MPVNRRNTAWDLADRHRSQSTRKPKTKLSRSHTPRLKEHFPYVVKFVYMSRYATTDQIQHRFHRVFSCDRTCRRHLKQLTDLGYLATADVKSTGVGWPNVYLCTIKGTKYMNQHFETSEPTAREEAKSLPSIEHELFLTEFDLSCLATAATRPDLDILFHERRYFHQDKRLKFTTTDPETNRPHTKHLIPDGGLLLKVTKGDRSGFLMYFTELDNGTELPNVVLAKFNTYFKWATNPAGQTYLKELYAKHGSQEPKATFRLFVIARRQGLAGTDQKRLADLFVQALRVSDDLRKLMWFTTVDVLKAHQHEQPPLAGNLWIRGRDADAWVSDYRSYADSLAHEKGSRPGKLKREFVLQKLPHLPRHPLFPEAP